MPRSYSTRYAWRGGDAMDAAQALTVVRSLANGVDPESGEVFPPESAYQRPQVVRALYEAASALERIERFERRKSQMPQKTGEPWTEDEDRKLLAAFDAGRALQELAAAHAFQIGEKARVGVFENIAHRPVESGEAGRRAVARPEGQGLRIRVPFH